MTYQLMRASKTDVPQLVDVYFNTFESPIVKLLKPNVPSTREWFRKSLERDMEKSHVHVYIVVNNVDDKREIVAFAKWMSPTLLTEADVPNEWPPEGDPALFRELISKVMRKMQEIMGDQQFWCTYSEAS